MRKFVTSVLLLLGLAGCTVHPRGELQQRQAALQAGKPYIHRQSAPPPALREDASLDELIQHALLTNPELEQKYWEWRSAIEQIPQEGTQPTNLVLFAGVPITNGSTAFDRTTVTAANDPMNDILWPAKLSRAAQRALDEAKAAGARFQKARYDLRAKVLSAWYDYALTAELIRLEEGNTQLLSTIAVVTEAQNRAGTAAQQDLLKARNEVDLSKNTVNQMQAQLASQRGALNALLNRSPTDRINAPVKLPTTKSVPSTDEQILSLAARRNPELKALAHEIQGKEQGIELARLQYFPDFSVSAGTDLAGAAQSLMGMITVPILRHEAIEAAINQAKANLRAAQSMRQQAHNDLNARIVADLSIFHDADRQLELFQTLILPRARQTVTPARSAYESGKASLLDLLDTQRSLIAIEKLVANLRIMRENKIADLEAIAATKLDTPPSK